MYSNISELLNAGLSIPSLYELKDMNVSSKETMLPVIYKNVSCINDECIDNTAYLELINKASISPSDKQKRSKKARKSKMNKMSKRSRK